MIEVYIYDTSRLDDWEEFHDRCRYVSEARLHGALRAEIAGNKSADEDIGSAGDMALARDMGLAGITELKRLYECRNSKSVRENIGASAVLDDALKSYGLREKNVRIETGRYGKPYLADNPDIHYNLSHSGIYTACAIGKYETGIDIQVIGKPRLQVAKRFFTDNEYDYIVSKPDEETVKNAFYRLWSLKESFVKAIGRGLDMALDSFEIQLDALNDDRITIRGTDSDTGISVSNDKYVFFEPEIAGYSAAVCYIRC